ncbi:MAG: hypothetical protein C0606_17090 [Hyphomicrobiales bacterium]|nr:MAG: hypothetical protein C0606_17090 [Hyphomicrobiales bacterium]
MPARLAGVLRLFVVFFALSAAAVAHAEDRFALVVGNADYEGEMLGPLKNPANDAALIAESLKKAGFEVDLVLNADLRTMKRSVQSFGKKLSAAGPGSTGLFYYSGHGFQAGGVNYLAPLGAQLQDEVDAEFEALSVDWVLGKLEGAHKGVNVVVLDACRNTALSRSISTQAQGLALMRATPRGSFISFATAPGSTATDGKGLNSPYSAAIAQQILRPGITIEAAFKNVRRAVVEATSGEQVPWDHSSLTDDVVFLPADSPAAIAAAEAASGDASKVQLELQLWNDVKDSGSAEQIQTYLEVFPQGAFAALAEARISALPGAGGTAGHSEVEKLFAQLASRATIVETPKRPHEFYSNARLREIQGDYPKARQDYMKYFAFGMPQVDPHYRFQNFLTVQEGRAGARQVYNGITQGSRDATLQFAEILLAEREERVAALTGFLKAHPDFSPALYELSRDYSAARLGQQSMTDKKEELRLLTAFMKEVEGGNFLGYFIDQQMAAEMLEDAKTRLAALSFLNQAALESPVTIKPTRSNQGWMVNLSIADRAKEIFVAKPGEEFRSTGFMQGYVDPQTGQPLAYPMFELPGNAEKMTIKVKYRDIRDEERGPYDVVFDPDMALVAGQKDILERLSSAWIAYPDKKRAYFTHLISYRCAISEVRYGLGTDEVSKTFAMPKCNPSDPHAIPRDWNKLWVTLPKGVPFLSVQLTYKDGSQSRVVRFDRP